MRKKIFALALLCPMLLSVTSCEKNEDENTANESDTETVECAEDSHIWDNESGVPTEVCSVCKTVTVSEKTCTVCGVKERITVNCTKINELVEKEKYTAIPEELFRYNAVDPEFSGKMQGSYFDGEFYYMAFINARDGHEVAKIGVFDKDGNNVRESAELKLDHANCISPSPDGNLFITHCHANDEGGYYRYSIVDRETLEIIETAELDRPFFAMAYCPEKGRFGSGQWSGHTLNVWDSEMNLLKEKHVTQPETLSQGMCCTMDGLYFVRSFLHGTTDISEIRYYDWGLNPVRRIQIDIPDRYEVEDISIVDGEAYVNVSVWDDDEGAIYKMHYRIKAKS